MRTLERVKYRRADNEEDKAAIFRMRHEAYTREGMIAPDPSGMFSDPLDETPNAWLIMLFIDGELASSIRYHVSASEDAPLPAMGAYSDILLPRLAAGQCLIDLTRHVNRLEFSRRFPEMPYITMRPAFLAEEYFDADYSIGAMRVEHQGAFKRMYGMVPWSEPRMYPKLNKLMPLLAYDCRASRVNTYKRYPFCQSSPAEQHELFCHSSSNHEDSRIVIRGKSAKETARARNRNPSDFAASSRSDLETQSQIGPRLY
jgi:hypothetical protein